MTARTINGATLTLTFSEAMNTAAKPAASRFTVKFLGVIDNNAVEETVEVDSYTLTSTGATLLLAKPIANHAALVSYSQPAGANAAKLEDAAGNALANFTDQNVPNQTPGRTVVLSASVLRFTDTQGENATNNGKTNTLSGTYSLGVELSEKPSGTVTVTLASASSLVELDADTTQTGLQSTLSFTTGGLEHRPERQSPGPRATTISSTRGTPPPSRPAAAATTA